MNPCCTICFELLDCLVILPVGTAKCPTCGSPHLTDADRFRAKIREMQALIVKASVPSLKSRCSSLFLLAEQGKKS
jgi:hypothetical protein